MGRMVENPRYNIITIRVSDEELKQLMGLKPVNVSMCEFVRALSLAGAKLVDDQPIITPPLPLYSKESSRQ